MKYNPHPYQEHATQHIIENDACGLFLEMGLGKTVSTLTAIVKLFNTGSIGKVLIIAPKRVAEDTWPLEIEKWDHLRHLSISVCLGSEKQRKMGLQRKADLYIINRENVPWLIAKYGQKFPFDMVVIDELSSFKSSKSIRFKAMRKIRPFLKRVIGLTGTPVPNGLYDLWSQMYLLDQGERLGKTKKEYTDKYFNEGLKRDHVVFKYNLKKGDDIDGEDIYQKEIYEKISDICISMQAKDYLQLPERMNVKVDIRFDVGTRARYDQFERDMVLAMGDEEITALSAAALGNKLLQFSNGAVYDAEGKVHQVHDYKLDALEEIIESANGEPVLVLYAYKHDLDRIMSRLKKYKPQEVKDSSSIRRWNEGKIAVMCGHPASMGHGLNLQAGGHIIVWFGLNWSLELYQQANARLDRQGQIKPVIIHHLVTPGTMDEDVMAALEGKAKGQDVLMKAVKARIEKYLNQ